MASDDLATSAPSTPSRWARRGMIAEIVLVVALAVATVIVLREQALNQDFSVDESRWIATSRYFWIAFVDRDVLGPAWQPGYVVLTHPPVARYVIGFGLWLQGWSPYQLNGRYDTERSVQFNRRVGNIPSRQLLNAARRVALVFGVGATLLLYLSGRVLAGPVAGATVVGLALGNPLLATLWTRALAESILAFCCLLVFLLASRLAPSLGREARRFAWAFGVGLALGLATATKLSGTLVASGLGLFVLLQQAVRSWTDRRLRGPGQWVDAAMVAILTFILVNPLLYPNPVIRTLMVFEHRRDEMDQQAIETPRLAVPDDVRVRAALLAQRTFVEYGTLRTWLGVPLDVPLGLLGFGVAFVTTWRSLRRDALLGPQTLLLCWAIAIFAISTLTLGFDLSHYFALPETVAVLLEGLAAAILVRQAIAAARRARRQKAHRTL